ncbi:MAG: hypothetical protein ABI839_03000 [Verrucomicrobiota bacterium]
MFRLLRARVFLPALAVFAVVLSGCSTPESRISDHPGLYQSLSARNQQLVSHGQIASSMSQDAVYLAWGAPDQKSVGVARGNNTETWIYVTTTSSPYGYGYGGYGGGYGGYGGGFGGYGGGFGRYGYGYPYGGFGGGGGVYRSHHGRRFAFYGDPFYDPFYFPSFAQTVSYPTRTVTFVNGRVVSYQYFVAPYRY